MLFFPGPDFVSVLNVEPVEYTDLCDPIKLGVFLPGVVIMILDISVNSRITKTSTQSQSTFNLNVYYFLLFIIIILQISL